MSLPTHASDFGPETRQPMVSFKRYRLGPIIRPLLAALAFNLAMSSSASAAGPVEILDEFDMAQVRVTDPYYMQLFQVDAEYLLRLDADTLLAGFKAVSLGQDPANGVSLYGGWEGGWSLLRGHTLGHYLTALAQAYKQTQGTDEDMNSEISSLIDHIIDEMKTYQDRKSNGYLFASPESHFDVVEGRIGGNMWVPWYTMHKIISGLVAVYEMQGNATALAVASKLGDWVDSRTSQWDSAMRNKVLGVEYGGMNDCLYELYKHTRKTNHVAAAHRFDEDTLFTPISQGNDILNGRHANTQIPKFVGALNRYRTVGETETFYRTAAEQFWSIVTNDHTYVTGGNSENEHFHVGGQLDANRGNINNETCNTYNMLKLSRDLFKVSGNVKYVDYYERAYINEILSAINPETGMTTYFKPMGTGYFKLFGRETDTFWCCNGTGMENYTKLNDGIYFHNEDTLYVNMYISSTLDWQSAGLSLTQSAEIPLSPDVHFSIDSAPATRLAVRFRKPEWLAQDQKAVLKVNGETQCVQEAEGYFEVSRIWSPGDSIDLTLPAEVRVSRLPDNKNAVAFTYGPIVLSAGMGTENMAKTTHLASEKATIPGGVTIDETIGISSGTIEDWLSNIKDNLVQTPGQLEFSLKNTDADDTLKFTPQYLRYKDRYGIYFDLEGPQGQAPTAGAPPGETSTDCDAPNDPSGGTSSGGGTNNAAGGAGNGTGATAGGVTGGTGSGSGGSTAGDAPTSGTAGNSGDQSGCGCRTTPQRNRSSGAAWAALFAFIVFRRRRRSLLAV